MKNPLMLTKRADLSWRQEFILRTVTVLASLVFTGIVLLFFGLDPILIFSSMIEGSFGTSIRIEQTIIKAIPLTIASLGILVAFKMKFWNIGGEGQIVMGALAASFMALNFPDLPGPLLLFLMFIASVIGGGLWALIPAAFKAKMGTNETIFTLMMNYIAIKFVMYLQYGPWKDPQSVGFPRIPTFSENAELPEVFGLHMGWIFALLCVVLIHFFINYTKIGYEITVVGESLETARYAGMNISKIIMIAMFISGGLCGFVGMIQVSAIEKTLVFGISNNYGFTAIITAWLARLNAVNTLFVCIAFAVLMQGAAYIQLSLGVPAAVASIVQGIILFFVLGSEFFLRYKITLNKNLSDIAKKEGGAE